MYANVIYNGLVTDYTFLLTFHPMATWIGSNILHDTGYG